MANWSIIEPAPKKSMETHEVEHGTETNITYEDGTILTFSIFPNKIFVKSNNPNLKTETIDGVPTITFSKKSI